MIALRRAAQWGALGLILGGAVPALAQVSTQCPPDTDGIDTDGSGKVDDDHLCLHLGAGDGFVDMADGRLQYLFGFTDLTGVPDRKAMAAGMLAATFPAPTLTVREGQKVFLTLTNVGMMLRPDLPDPHTVHWHGFPNAAPIFDGVPDASVAVNMGSSLTYFYEATRPGTYMYHCHVEATEHMQMGMLGNLYVTPRQDGQSFTHAGRTFTRFAYGDGDGSTGYDQALPLQISGFDPDFHDANLEVQPLAFDAMEDRYGMLNGRGYPDTINPAVLDNGWDGHPAQPLPSLIQAKQGERILLRLSSLSTTEHFTLRALGLPMRVVGSSARLLRSPDGTDLSYEATTVTLGGGEAVDVLLDTANVAPGTYFLFTTNLDYLTNDREPRGGMMTEIVITAGGGGGPAAAASPRGRR